MNRTLFVASHLESGSIDLVDILNENERIQMIESNIAYNDIHDIAALHNQKHKVDNAAAIFGDHLLFNVRFLNKSLYPCAKFIYFIRSGATLNQLVGKYNYTPETALNYYYFRIRRLYEMASQTPGSVFLTKNDLINGKGLDLIEEFLDLPEHLILKKLPEQSEDVVPYPLLQEAENYYERYFYLFRKLDLIRP